MKRLCSLLLVLTLLLSAIPSLAETTILFRNIPWKSSATQVHAYLRKENPFRTFEETGFTTSPSMNFYMLTFEKSDYFLPIHDEASVEMLISEKLDVAGYSAMGHLYFSPSVIDGEVQNSNDGMVLYAAAYLISIMGRPVEDVFNGLKEKLISIYGEPYAIAKEIKSKYFLMWQDSYGNQLIMEVWDDEAWYLYIYYLSADMNTILKTADDAISYQTINSPDTSGL